MKPIQQIFDTSMVVNQRQFKTLQIDRSSPYTIYRAFPLISCFGYLLTYPTKNGKMKSILYHAYSGVPFSELRDIIKEIGQDADLKDVKILFAIPTNISASSLGIEKARAKFEEAGFNVVANFQPAFQSTSILYADNRGNFDVHYTPLLTKEYAIKVRDVIYPFLQGLYNEAYKKEWENSGSKFGLFNATPKYIKQLRDILKPFKDTRVTDVVELLMMLETVEQLKWQYLEKYSGKPKKADFQFFIQLDRDLDAVEKQMTESSTQTYDPKSEIL